MKPPVWACVTFSFIALALMGLQLVNNGVQVGAWVIGLVLVAAVPWLSVLVQRVKVPGIDVQFRK